MDFQSEIRLFSSVWYYHFNFSLSSHKDCQDSVISIVTGLQVEQPRNYGRSKGIFVSPVYISALGPPSLLFSGCLVGTRPEFSVLSGG
jgi:hypothetical protein